MTLKFLKKIERFSDPIEYWDGWYSFLWTTV